MNRLYVKVFSLICIPLMSVLNIKESKASIHPTGNEFLSFCNVTTGDVNGDAFYARCENYIQETRVQLSQSSVHGIRACIPEKVTNLKLVFMAIHWMNDNPNQLYKEADEIVARAFQVEWPCKD